MSFPPLFPSARPPPMLFHTFEFALLFALVAPFAYFGGSRVRRVSLLLASYAFYAWFSAPLLSLMLGSTLLDFTVGRAMHAEERRRRRRLLLVLSLTGNLGLLFIFKYAGWFADSVNSIAGWTGADPVFGDFDIILPLGISFYTFQTLSYTIDIYRGQLQPTRSLLNFALFVSFFPQLVAGPIVRASYFLPQLAKKITITGPQLRSAFGLFLFGLLKKVVVADRLAATANEVFGQPENYAGLDVLFACYAFAFQIYCDFSGYTDMARGIARAFGYDVGINFNYPYSAVGIRDFWTRWHMSLSTWLRDYLYISLGGGRRGSWRVSFNVFVTMLLGGLWHGANWTFVVWGLMHWLWISVERVSGSLQPARWNVPLAGVWTRLITFHVVCVTWLFFRAESVSDAWLMGTRLFEGRTDMMIAPLALVPIPFLLLVEWAVAKGKADAWCMAHPMRYWIAVAAGLWLALAFGDFGGNEFVYFQF